MKEELTSSTDQESPNSTGTDADQAPPEIRPQYGPSIAPATKAIEASAEIQKNRKKKVGVDSAYLRHNDDQYTGSTEEEDMEEYWNERRMEQTLLEENHNTIPKPKKTDDSLQDTAPKDRQTGFFDVFASFLQNKDQVAEKPEKLVKEKKRLGRPPKKKPEVQSSKSEYFESSEGEDLGEFRVEAADPTILKISRISPGSRTPVRNSEPRTEAVIPEPQPHMVASTNGTVVTLRRITPTKPKREPVNGLSEGKSVNPTSAQDVKSVTTNIKSKSARGYQFADNDLNPQMNSTDIPSESQDTSSGTYTLRKRKKVNFNLLAEGNLSDNDFIPDSPEAKKSGEFIESPPKKNGRARKKKPFDKAHFMNYNRRLLRLRRGVCILLETMFPEMIYPRRFNPESHAVEYLVDYVSNIVQDKELAPHRISRCYGEIDWDPNVLLCSAPKDCLRHLRRRVMNMLKALLPGLKVNRYFDLSSTSVDALVEEITFVNAQQTSSQVSNPAVPLPSDLSGAATTCRGSVATATLLKSKAVGTKRKSRDNNATDNVEVGQGDSKTLLLPTAKGKREEKLTDSAALMPPPPESIVGSADHLEPPTKKLRKSSVSLTGNATDQRCPSTNTGTTELAASVS